MSDVCSALVHEPRPTRKGRKELEFGQKCGSELAENGRTNFEGLMWYGPLFCVRSVCV
jgi:hypothetical protein